MRRIFFPMLVVAVLLGLLDRGLHRDPQAIPSPLIGKLAPAFALPNLETSERFGPEAWRGKVWILNVWASWCSACRDEHASLLRLSQNENAVLVGLDYKDSSDAAKHLLRTHGNPYALVLQDIEGNVGIDYGVYGVPETFLIDKQGIVRHKLVGALNADALQNDLLPWIEKLHNE